VRLYNSYSQQIEEFHPQEEGAPVTLYVCGITPYDTTHLGHAFTYVMTDILIRYFAYRGQQVHYVQNVTDIDDDILRKAREEEEDWRQLGSRWTRHFIEDMRTLNVRAPDRFPHATEMIPEIVERVQQLVQHGVAYVVAGNVYFEVKKWSAFGQLSDLTPEEMLPLANERGNHPDDPKKRDPLDFVLWQAEQPGEPSWESPWGKGRPGWHIECSTMATKLLGDTIDIHIGGSDLLFPHHECEIAQITPITGEQYVRYWMHIAMVRKAGEKMSKSLGNLVMVRDLLERFSRNAIRLYLAQQHYRESWSYDEEELQQAEKLAANLAKAANLAGTGGIHRSGIHRSGIHSGEREKSTGAVSATQLAFQEALDDDLNTPQAIPIVETLVTQILEANEKGDAVGQAPQLLQDFCTVFGLYFHNEPPSAPGWLPHLQRLAD